MRIAIGLEYDGRAFCGWQAQPNGCGVQNALEAALGRIAGHPVRVVAAGRTDAGVHAIGQVAHFDTDAQRPLTAWIRGANAMLPPAVALIWAREVPSTFHARFSAIERCYQYRLLSRPSRPGVENARVGWFHRPLDLEAMREAAGLLLGVHDFSAFRAAGCQAKSPVKDLRRLEIARCGDLMLFECCADAFLHHMVRNIVGALVYVGKGRHAPGWVKDVLDGGRRSAAAPTFAPDGLYFVQAKYDAHWGIPDPARRLAD
ncbi:MAG: tRNA pseudouridine(38-40) synthase TruA [Betaproteobacteria bacterium]|nr:tRNA pseudouridine(38-40) synthase TruA [Betaproteobacteria bacterium]